ncbi:MAG TPA: DUF6150 family protein, partial [bacterium]|nr:DUF6150 family protein [bacterium]
PFFAWLSAAPPPAPGVRPADVEFCKIYGAVYLERDDRYRPFCSFIAYEEPNDALADLHVFREDNKLFADQPGLWYITPTKAFADYVVFVTPERGFADFSIYYTTARSFAGCRR